MAKEDGEGKVNKMEVVQEAINALGGDPSPREIMAYVKDKHGVEFGYALVASYKSIIKKKSGVKSTGKKRGRPAGSKNTSKAPTPMASVVASAPSTPNTYSAPSSTKIDVNDLFALRGLINTLGADAVIKLVKSFS